MTIREMLAFYIHPGVQELWIFLSCSVALSMRLTTGVCLSGFNQTWNELISAWKRLCRWAIIMLMVNQVIREENKKLLTFLKYTIIFENLENNVVSSTSQK